MEIKLRNLGALIAKCWSGAEIAAAKAIAEKYFDPPEEAITFLFSRELQLSVSEASGKHLFAQAFLNDFRSQVPDLPKGASIHCSGLVARVNFHSRRHEGLRSASDLGIVVTQPSVYKNPGFVRVVRSRSSALMAQAKLNLRKGRNGHLKWRDLTKPQQRLIPEHSAYCALLLYRLEGTARSTLAPFRRQPCKGYEVAEITQWLRSGTFPKEMASAAVIQSLSAGTIGTRDPEIIARFVDPPSFPNVIEILVSWDDGKGPPEHLALSPKISQEVVQFVRR